MKTPTINFVWVGPPQFNHGGQDVLGPETLDVNFKAFKEASSQNPMVFWCQEKYKEAYETYFTARSVTLTVKAIEEALNSATNPLAATVLDHYNELTTEASSTLDRVFFKDMFFNFLLATEGGYVMDTGMYADLSIPVRCGAYDTLKFPISCPPADMNINLKRATFEPMAAQSKIEVCMQYAPNHSPDALTVLQTYLNAYDEHLELKQEIMASRYMRPAEKARSIECSLAIVSLTPLFQLLVKHPSTTDIEAYTWPTIGLKQIETSVSLPECGLNKLYLRSYTETPKPQIYTVTKSENFPLLTFLFDHSLQTDINAIYKSEANRHIGTLLTMITSKTALDKEQSPDRLVERIAIMRLFLQQGANPNAAYSIDEAVRTPLLDAAVSQSPDAVQLLIDYGAHIQAVDYTFILSIYKDEGTSIEIKALLFDLISKYEAIVTTTAAAGGGASKMKDEIEGKPLAESEMKGVAHSLLLSPRFWEMQPQMKEESSGLSTSAEETKDNAQDMEKKSLLGR